ncbi:hypothetical protein Ae201684_011515 [Aphanomyces euteiches]|uniref:Uncharacterized protein n=1 Tax=Aphanomyces euteiches TaxID=100861 RepID=A0A6G0WUW6_9STRA|nr:hypothetical protein Ae201684_011515 [Aphanomyces euteiches]
MSSICHDNLRGESYFHVFGVDKCLAGDLEAKDNDFVVICTEEELVELHESRGCDWDRLRDVVPTKMSFSTWLASRRHR